MEFTIKGTYNKKESLFYFRNKNWRGGEDSKNRSININPRPFDRFVRNFAYAPYTAL